MLMLSMLGLLYKVVEVTWQCQLVWRKSTMCPHDILLMIVFSFLCLHLCMLRWHQIDKAGKDTDGRAKIAICQNMWNILFYLYWPTALPKGWVTGWKNRTCRLVFDVQNLQSQMSLCKELIFHEGLVSLWTWNIPFIGYFILSFLCRRGFSSWMT